jgi:transcriptional regulatory protein LevR
MRLLDRFTVLRNGGVIDRETHELLQEMLARLEHHWHLAITDVNGASLMTYLALMLMRLKRNEVTPLMDVEQYAEYTRDEFIYMQSLNIVQDLGEMAKCVIPESEQQYLVANLRPILTMHSSL